MNKKISFLTILGILALPILAYAEPTVNGMVNGAVDTTLTIASGVVVILWVVTGFLFLTAQGDPAKLKAGRTALLSATAGTILVIAASTAIKWVGSAFNLS